MSNRSDLRTYGGAALTLLALVTLVTLPIVASAKPAEQSLPTCSGADLSGVTVLACSGYFAGNLVNTSPADRLAVNTYLTALGLPGTGGVWLEKIENLNGANTLNFTTSLNGVSFLAIHKGGGAAQGTAFYKIEAGSNLYSFDFNLASSSNAALYGVSAVPEPQSYALLAAGLAVMAFVAKRRKAA